MKKKMSLTLVALLSVTALAACSTSKQDTKASSSTSSSSKVEESTTTSSSSSVELKESTVTYITDEEIEGIQTIGDVKKAFDSLTESYIADFDEIISQVPEKDQKTLEGYRDQVSSSFDQAKETLEKQLAAVGTDETAIPATSKQQLVDGLKKTRDQLQEAMKTARGQAENLLK